LDVVNRDKKEKKVASIVRKGFRPFRKLDTRRQPPWAQIRRAIVDDLDKQLEWIRLDSARNLVARHGTDPLPADWRPKPRNRARDLLMDLQDVSRSRWLAMKRPRSNEDINAYLKKNLGEDRVRAIAITEVAIAHQQGEQDALEYMRKVQKVKGLRARWKCYPGCCKRCRALDGKFTRKKPPLHPKCRCQQEYEQRKAA